MSYPVCATHAFVWTVPPGIAKCVLCGVIDESLFRENMRHRSDNSKKDIVDGLRAAGYEVYIIERPCDLLVGRIWNTPPAFTEWRLMEVKTVQKSGKIRLRKDQEEQTRFLERTGTPTVSTLEQALEVMRGM